jgi:hypothetical protein
MHSMNQLTFTELFDRIEKEAQVRNDLVDQITANDKVKALLHCLMGFPHTVLAGDWYVTVSWKQIGSKLLKTLNTVKSYVHQATPFVEVLRGGDANKNPHTKHTFVIHWLTIVNREPTSEQAADCTVRNAPSLQAADCTADDDAWSDHDEGGYQNQRPRVSDWTPEGVNFGVGGYQNEGINSPRTPSENLLLSNQISNTLLQSSPSLTSSKQASTKRAPALFPRHQRSQSRQEVRKQARLTSWPRWEAAIAARQLSNPEHVCELVAIAIELEAVQGTEEDCFNIFCQAAKQIRMNKEGSSKTPFGLFASNVASNRWQCDPCDRQVADRMIRRAYLHKNKEAAAVRREIESVAQTVGQNLPLEVTSNKRHRDAEIEELKRRFPQIGFGHKPK